MTMTSTDVEARPYVPIGEGVIFVPAAEREFDRFGSVSLIDPKTAATLDQARSVDFDGAPIDQHGWLVMEILDGAYAGNVFLLGKGLLWEGREYGYPVIGLVPDGYTTTPWLDPGPLYLAGLSLVRLLWCPAETGQE